MSHSKQQLTQYNVEQPQHLTIKCLRPSVRNKNRNQYIIFHYLSLSLLSLLSFSKQRHAYITLNFVRATSKARAMVVKTQC